MKIKKINTHIYSSKYGNEKVFGQPLKVRSGVILEIISDQNIKGYGESYQASYIPEITKITLDHIKQKLVGKKINNINKIIRSLDIPFVTDKGFIKSVLSSFEIALWDLKAKTLKKPLYKLLNPNYRKKNILCYASGGSVVFKEKQIQKDINILKMINHNSYKMRIGYLNWETDLKRIKFAKKQLNNNKLIIDAIMGTLKKWNYKILKKKLPILNKLNLLWLEEPFHPEDIDSYIKLKKDSINKIKIAIGESFTSYNEFKYFIENNLCDIVQPDITQLGIFDSIKVIKLANKKKKMVSMHVWGSPVSYLSNLNFAIAFDEVNFFECPLVEYEFIKKFYRKYSEIMNGNIYIKKNFYGTGIEIKTKDYQQNKFKKGSGFKING